MLDEETSLPLLKHAFDAGINTWDTADTYSNGQSERLIRKAIETYSIPRSRLVLMTKCFFGVDDDPSQPRNDALMTSKDGAMVNRTGLSRKRIFDAVEASVERLGTYIDVLQIHRLDLSTPPLEIMRALNDVIEKGWVRYIGASSMACWQLQSEFSMPAFVRRLAAWLMNENFSQISRTSLAHMATMSSSPCRISTTCSIAKKSVR